MFDPTTFTGIHTWLSLVAIGAGAVVAIGLIAAQTLPQVTWLFLATAIATSATGYGFPFTVVLPSHVVGALSLVVLAVAILARYRFHLIGAWRWIYAVASIVALYFLVFVAIAQAFQKVPALSGAAPMSPGTAFAVSQLVVLILFVVLAILAARKFRPG